MSQPSLSPCLCSNAVPATFRSDRSRRLRFPPPAVFRITLCQYYRVVQSDNPYVWFEYNQERAILSISTIFHVLAALELFDQLAAFQDLLLYAVQRSVVSDGAFDLHRPGRGLRFEHFIDAWVKIVADLSQRHLLCFAILGRIELSVIILVSEGSSGFFGYSLCDSLSVNKVSIKCTFFFWVDFVIFIELVGMILLGLGEVWFAGVFAQRFVHFVAVHLIEALVVLNVLVSVDVSIKDWIFLDIFFSSVSKETVFAGLAAKHPTGRLLFWSWIVVDVNLVPLLLKVNIFGGVHVHTIILCQFNSRLFLGRRSIGIFLNLTSNDRIDLQVVLGLLAYFAGLKLPVDPNRQVLQIHSFGIIIIQHIRNNLRDSFPIIFLDQIDSFVDDCIQNVIILGIVTFLTGQQRADLKQNHAEGKHIALLDNILIVNLLFSASDSDDELRRGQNSCIFFEFLICIEIDEFIRQQFEATIIVEDVFRIDILICDPIFLQMGKCKGDSLYQSFNILHQKQFVGVQSSLQQLLQGYLYVLKEEDLVFCLNFDAIFEGS